MFEIVPKGRRLPVSRAPYAFESLPGFIIRLAEANCYPSPLWVYQLLDAAEFKTAHTYFKRIGDSLPSWIDQPSEMIEEIAFRPGRARNRAQVIAFGKIFLRAQDVIASQPQVCPACIAEYGAAFAVWELRLFLACPRHGCYLTSKCHSCGAKLSWLRPGISTCKACEADLCGGQTVPAPEELRVVAALCALKGNVPEGFCAEVGAGPWRTLDLASFLACASLLLKARMPKHVRFGETRREDIRAPLEHIAKVFTDWPHGYDKFLHEIMALDFKEGKAFVSGVTAAFGRFYKRVFAEDVAGLYAPLKDGLIGYLERALDPRFLTGKSRIKTKDGAPLEASHVSKAEATKALGISSETFWRLAKAGLIEVKSVQQRRSKVHFVSKVSVETYRKQALTWIGRKELEEYLGVSRPFCDKLIASGLLDVRKSEAGKLQEKWLINVRAPESLMSRLSRHTCPVFIPSKWYLNFNRLYHVCANRGLAAQQFIEQVFGGAFPVRHIERRNNTLDTYIFSYWDVFAFWESDLVVSRLRAADILGCSEKSIIWLIRNGKLDEVRGATASAGQISLRDVLSFAEEYVSLDQIVKWSGNKREVMRFRRRLQGSHQIGPASPLADKFIAMEHVVAFLGEAKLLGRGAGPIRSEAFMFGS